MRIFFQDTSLKLKLTELEEKLTAAETQLEEKKKHVEDLEEELQMMAVDAERKGRELARSEKVKIFRFKTYRSFSLSRNKK